MATTRPGAEAPSQRELEEAIRDLEDHLTRLRALLEEARTADESEDETDWSVFDAEPGSEPPESR